MEPGALSELTTAEHSACFLFLHIQMEWIGVL
jgi:hypothetical protein